MKKKKIVDLGCGENKHDDAFGVDVEDHDCVDKVFDIDGTSWSFLETNSIEEVIAYHVLEHMRYLDEVMEEIKRICMNGAKVYVKNPILLTPKLC